VPDVALPVATSLLDATVSELRKHAPFDRMETTHLQWLVGRLSVVYFASDVVILEPRSGIPSYLFVVKQGNVLGFETEEQRDDAPRWRLSAGECFPLGALLGERAVTSIYRAGGDTFCYRLPAADYAELLRLSAPFHEFATRRLASLLAQSKRSAHPDHAEGLSRQPLERPVRELLTRPPVACTEQASVREALETMRRERVGSILVTREDGTGGGIFTLRDLRDRVALAGYDIESAVAGVMTRDLITLPADAMAFDAAVTMARHGFHHLVLVEAGYPVGIVSEGDLFALQRIGLTALSAALRSAGSRDALIAASQGVRLLSRSLLAQGVSADQITRIISTLNDRLTERAIELETTAAGIYRTCLCWIAMGSEGRQEQMPATDQDNGIIFPDSEGDSADAVRERLQPVAQRVNETLAACGFPLCKGGIMASNLRWCLSLSEWKRQFAEWIQTGDGKALLNASIFFDFRALWGDEALAFELRGWLTANARGRDLFLRLMAQNALYNGPPLGLLRDFATERHGARDGVLDIKTNGAALFIDVARILALASGIPQTNTIERLHGVAAARGFGVREVEAWIGAFHFVQSVRLVHQHQQIHAGGQADNYIDPEQLNPLDRRILKEAFWQARTLQERLRLDYRL
jgi:CBS domain-containing protein